MRRKNLLYQFFINLLALYLITLLISSVSLTGGIKPLILSSLALAFLNKLVKPILKLLLLPFNLLTLGLFSWLINVITLYLLTLFVPAFKISPFYFDGLSLQGFTIPSINFNLFYTYILVSFSLSLLTSTLRWLTN